MGTLRIKLGAALTATILGFAGLASAVDITIKDNNLGNNSFGGGPFGAAWEDNETEPGTEASQKWDLEAFRLEGKTLQIIGGWNFSTGVSGTAPGDLFIKIGGPAPSGSPSYAYGTVANSIYGYTYALDLSQANGLRSSANIIKLGNNSRLDSVEYDNLGSNPWRYNRDGTVSGQTAISYTTGLTDLETGLKGGSHNMLTIDLSFLGEVPSGTPVWLSHTMECGNDSLKGYYDGGFRVPDGGTSVALLGMGLSAVVLLGRKLRSA